MAPKPMVVQPNKPLIVGPDPTMAGEISLGARNSSSEASETFSLEASEAGCVFFKHLACFAATLIRSWVFEDLDTQGITELIKLNDPL